MLFVDVDDCRNNTELERHINHNNIVSGPDLESPEAYKDELKPEWGSFAANL